jgi:hypothetical protein
MGKSFNSDKSKCWQGCGKMIKCNPLLIGLYLGISICKHTLALSNKMNMFIS